MDEGDLIMAKQIFRLTESELHQMVKESVVNILKEWNGSDELERDEKRAGSSLEDEDEETVEESSFGKGGNGVIKGDIYGTKLSKDGSDYAQELLRQNGVNSMEEEGETFQNNQNYSHFAVNKATNKIVNGWDYSEYDPSELRQFKKDYFDADMIDYGFNPKDYKIVTGKFLLRQGIDPNDNNNWANS
jgi:hypothetical protein